jgi:hypothetical protein
MYRRMSKFRITLIRSNNNMKRTLLLLSIFLSSCSTHSTAPVAAPPYPFPSTFKQIAITFQNLPGHWSSSSSTWNYTGIPPIDTSTVDTSTGPHSGSVTFTFDTASFVRSMDTIRAQDHDIHEPGINQGTDLTMIVDDYNAKIIQLQISFYDWEGTTDDYTNSDYSIVCQNLSYIQDTSNEISIVVSGKSVQSVLQSFTNTYATQGGGKTEGSSTSQVWQYIGSVSDSAVLKIDFIK